MTKRRTLTLITATVLIFAATSAWTQEPNSDAEDQDIFFIEKCLQRAAEEKIPEERVDDFIDNCLNEFYRHKEQTPTEEGGNQDSVPDGSQDNDSQNDEGGDTGRIETN